MSGNALLRAKAALVKREELELQIRSLLFSFDEESWLETRRCGEA